MDLLATVRKEGSRGGTGNFKWSDVQSSTRRENYLGHSVMAPVGRWQQGRDLNWYSKADDKTDDNEDISTRAARERKEEIRKIKEAEEDALARALGLPVAPRNNANMEPLGNRETVDKALKETTQREDEGANGIGYGNTSAGAKGQVLAERIEGNAEAQDKELQYALKEYQRRHRDGRKNRHHRSRSRSRSRDRGTRSSRQHRPGERRYQQHLTRSRSRSPEKYTNTRRARRSRSNSRDDERRHRHNRPHRTDRSRSPLRRSDSDQHRRHKNYDRRRT